MVSFFKLLFCTLAFAASVSANILIEGDSAALPSSIGDTVSLVARTRLNYGENHIKWELVSGQGKFTDATADSTGFIPSTDSATIRMVTQALPIYELTEQRTKYFFDKNSVRVPRDRAWGRDYGLRFYIDAKEETQYALVHENEQSLAILNLGEDSTFAGKTVDKRTYINDKCFLGVTPNTKNYIYVYLSGYPNVFMKDSVFVRLSKTFSISASHTGKGMVFVDSAKKVFAIDSASVTRTFTKVIENDSITIYASPDSNYVFDHWEKESGTCDIEDSTKDTTRILHIRSDCKVKATFKPGTIYNITSAPTEYNFTENSYARKVSSGHLGVRFRFIAPSTGEFTIVVSNDMLQDSLYYLQYKRTNYDTLSISQKFIGSYSKKLNLTAGDTVAIVVYKYKKDDNPFYISYATQSYKLELGSNGNGKTIPDTGYAEAYVGTKYSIGAEADSGYRFSNWQIVAGSPTIEDTEAPYTFVSVVDDAKLKAQFKPSQIHTLTKTKQIFNFQQDYFNESTQSEIRFTWTPPDTNTYVIQIQPIDPIHGIFKDYGADSTFADTLSLDSIVEAASFIIKGKPGTPLYWTFRDFSKNIPNTSFAVWISLPYILNIKTSNEGSVNPSGKLYTSSGVQNVITAWPYGGYKFKSWVNTEGDMTIANPKNSRTSVSLKDSICTIKATFMVDKSAEPELNISSLDIGNYPEICAQVSVTDKNSGNTFYGLVSDDFTLTEDGKFIQPQVTSVNKVTGVSVVIVVDQSNSMHTNKRMDKAKDAIRSFINDMGPYDRTAIVGFIGNVYFKDTSATASETDSIKVDSTIVHQTMTSNKALLLQATDSIKAMGRSTNILTGTYIGIQQIGNESNATAVIVFSDGDNNSGGTNIHEAIELAQKKNTPIYTIGLETETKYPLEYLAKSTGGTFSLASDASELAGLYAGIRDNVLSQYVVCYQTPDTVQNGETHNVAIGMKFNKITTSDTVQWSENAIPPTVTLTPTTWDLINKSQAENTSLFISVYVKSSIKIMSADVFLRNSGDEGGQFTTYPMQHVRDSLWVFTIPADLVVAPGLDFYVTATDSLGQTGKSPKIRTPSKEPYTIFINNDIPNIEVVSVACEDSTSDIKTFTFSIKDSDGIGSASLFFRDSKMVLFDEIDLLYVAETDIWSTEFPANVRDFSDIDYYIRVTDARGATVRYLSSGFSTTEACEIKDIILPEDSSIISDTIPEDSILPPSPRDSIVYSLIADTAEIYDKNLDGRADFVRVHFKEENDDNISSIDSVFWNSNRGEWRYVAAKDIKKNRTDGKWVEGYLNKPYKYGLTKADTSHKPFLAFSTVLSEELENVKLTDKVGAVPVKATIYPGKVGLKEYMDPSAIIPPDTLIVRMSEPIRNVGNENAWENLFRYSASCKDTVSQPIKLKDAPQTHDGGQQWALILDSYSLKAGFCLFTDPSATYEDLSGNSLGRGGIDIEGKNGVFYLSEVKPVQAVSGIGKTQKWIPPKGSSWEELPDSLSAISVKALSPYTAEIYIFDGIGTYVTHFKQKFGYDGEMEAPNRANPDDQSKLGFLHWNQRSEKGRRAGTGIYIWKILFTFEDGHKETRTIKTGIYRRGKKEAK